MIRDVATNRGCLVPVRNVAAITIRRVQRVVAVDVARRARRRHWRHMRAHQSESRGAVIEFSIGPLCDGMARGASRRSGRKTGRDVIRHISADCRGLVPVRRMTAHAVGRIQRVVIVDVAGSTWRRSRRHMRARQRESRHAVIKRCRIPAFRGVAVRAISQSKCRARGGVHWVIRILPSRQVAARSSARSGRDV